MKVKLLLLLLTLSIPAFALPNVHQVALTWVQTTTVPVDGDCVYRTQVQGVYTQANQLFCSTTPSTAYLDLTVKAGQTYWFVTTAIVGPIGLTRETPFSNEVKTVIPQDDMPNTNLSAASQ